MRFSVSGLQIQDTRQDHPTSDLSELVADTPRGSGPLRSSSATGTPPGSCKAPGRFAVRRPLDIGADKASAFARGKGERQTLHYLPMLIGYAGQTGPVGGVLYRQVLITPLSL